MVLLFDGEKEGGCWRRGDLISNGISITDSLHDDNRNEKRHEFGLYSLNSPLQEVLTYGDCQLSACHFDNVQKNVVGDLSWQSNLEV